MSAARARTPADPFLDGLEQGKLTRSLLPATSPLTPDQTAWLGGFLAGLFQVAAPGEREATLGEAGHAPSPVPPPAAPAAHEPTYTQDNPFAAQLVRVEALAGRGKADAWLLAASLEGHRLDYEAGDRVGVSRQSDPDRVRDLLRRLAARGQEEVRTPRGSGPAWRALLEEVDIDTPTQAFVELLLDVAQDREERRSLDACLYGLPDGTTVSGLLRRFPSARPHVAEVVSTLRPIEPTLHPIAASPLAADARVDLVVTEACGTTQNARAVARLAADLGTGRLRQGDWLPIFIAPRPALRLPEDPTSPVVFIGTECAATTFRCLLEHRALTRANGRNWVFVSAEAPAHDVMHRQDFDRWVDSRHLTRFEPVLGTPEELAARLVAHGDMLARWLLDQSVVVIDAPPAAVPLFERALATVLERHTRLPADAARARVEEWRGTRLRITST